MFADNVSHSAYTNNIAINNARFYQISIDYYTSAVGSA